MNILVINYLKNAHQPEFWLETGSFIIRFDSDKEGKAFKRLSPFILIWGASGNERETARIIEHKEAIKLIKPQDHK